ASELDEMLKPLIANPHVLGVLVVNKEGSVIKTTFDAVITKQYAEKLSKYLEMSQNMIQEIDEPDAIQKNELTLLRIRSKKYEIILTPGIKMRVEKCITAQKLRLSKHWHSSFNVQGPGIPSTDVVYEHKRCFCLAQTMQCSFSIRYETLPN
ncbi:1246_t:CDS:2, partial [Ambispora leptoticha]